MAQPVPLYIVTSPRPRVGKTLLARLLIEFFRDDRRPLVGFDLNPRDPMLAERFPKLVWPVDISHTRGQMELFDRLLADTISTKIVDLGYGPFDSFFAIMREIGFTQEARRRSIDPIVLFIADSGATTARNYAEVKRRVAATFVPVHNESVSLMFDRAEFPATRSEYGVVHMERLSPIVRGVVDRPNFSFSAYMAKRTGGPTEVHAWVGKMYAEFREFELRLLMGRLSQSLSRPAEPRRRSLAR
jgi:hypothetical protein